jgi:hypothetical protein
MSFSASIQLTVKIAKILCDFVHADFIMLFFFWGGGNMEKTWIWTKKEEGHVTFSDEQIYFQLVLLCYF